MPTEAGWTRDPMPRCAAEQDNTRAHFQQRSLQETPLRLAAPRGGPGGDDYLREVRKLTSGMGHDLNNMLMVVMGNLELLKKRSQPCKKSLQLIEDALSGAERAALLARHMLAFGAPMPTIQRDGSLAKLLQAMTQLLTTSFSAEICLKMALRTETIARCNGKQLELAIMNLAMRAIERLPHGLALKIEAAETVLGQRDVAALAAGRYARIVLTPMVKTTDAAQTVGFASFSIGQTAQVAARIDDEAAMEISVEVVREIAARANGLLELRDTPMGASEATLWIPCGPPTSVVTAQPQVPVLPLTVLLVEDDPLVRTSVARMIADLGHTVIEAGSGTEALDTLAMLDVCDVMMTDLEMRGMTGLNLAAAVSRFRPSVRTIILSGICNAVDLRVGAQLWLSKPFDQAQLATALAIAGR